VETAGLEVEVCTVGLQTTTRENSPASHSLHQYIDFLLLPYFALTTHFI
jgi:hypothetical protein